MASNFTILTIWLITSVKQSKTFNEVNNSYEYIPQINCNEELISVLGDIFDLGLFIEVPF